MEWNDIISGEVTTITASMLPKNFSGDVRTTRAVQEQIAKLIDDIGEESASSQGLNKVITSAEKLRNNPGHTIFLLKDHRGNDGKGAIIGMLKVGRKHLFLFDSKEQVHEVEPLCVLDFFIVRDKQRLGFGRMLYDYMLHELEVTAGQMAIDGPSDKMVNFLARNYGIKKLMRQNNNFAVSPAFFDRSDDEISNCTGGPSLAPSPAVGRFAAPKPNSAIANVIHGAGNDDATRSSPAVELAPEASAAVAGPAPYDMDMWDDDWEEPSEPELDDAYEFDADQPAAERRDERRARGPLRYSSPALERPATLPVQHAAAAAAQPVPSAPPAEVPAAGMPSGGASAAQSAAGTPSGAAGRRDSQLTDRGYFDVKYYHNKLW